MFHYYFKPKKSKHRANQKEFYEEYIDTGRELVDRTHVSMPAEFEERLHGSIIDMRRDFKNTAKRILGRRPGREPKVSIYETRRLAKLSLVKGHVSL